jgi:hypothetical protein
LLQLTLYLIPSEISHANCRLSCLRLQHAWLVITTTLGCYAGGPGRD